MNNCKAKKHVSYVSFVSAKVRKGTVRTSHVQKFITNWGEQFCAVWHFLGCAPISFRCFLVSSIFIIIERRLCYQAVLSWVKLLYGFTTSTFYLCPKFSEQSRAMFVTLQFVLSSYFGHFHCFFVAFGLLTNNMYLFILDF